MSKDYVYAELTPAEAWAKIGQETGLRMRTEKVGGDFDWTDFALNCEAAIGLLLHERNRLARLVVQLGGDLAAFAEARRRGSGEAERENRSLGAKRGWEKRRLRATAMEAKAHAD